VCEHIIADPPHSLPSPSSPLFFPGNTRRRIPPPWWR
jgi:hypothetical protein